MTLRVSLVIPVGEIWTGAADRVIAKTLDGDVGILTGHAPLIGILAPGSVVRIQPQEPPPDGGWIEAAIDSGFLSVADNRVSILVHDAILGSDVDKAGVMARLESALGAAESGQDGEQEKAGFLRAQLRAAGEEA
ncbi:MAG TPA: F0F1 ATP synthase subunit epsilon [Streptosporangiaceae bacterium]|nr:F0F1 ATP synthase subunit epsilon [Streptosporangiaceae bacterium]